MPGVIESRCDMIYDVTTATRQHCAAPERRGIYYLGLLNK